MCNPQTAIDDSRATGSGLPPRPTAHGPLPIIPRPRRAIASPRRRSGFTMVELLVVILILAVLIALLLPAINAALRSAKNTAVGGEINQMAQALAQFKSQYGDYPPSRVYLAENGDYSVVNSTAYLPAGTSVGDITLGQLAQRSISALRKFFPRVNFNTQGIVYPGNFGSIPTGGRWYDFNGNGVMDAPYILQGHECLVFFLGGVPLQTNSGYGLTGFGKDPTNPFTNSIVGSTNYSGNRQPPLFEFNPGRLMIDPTNPYTSFTLPQIPGYVDSLGNTLGNGQINFYAYFSAYGNGGYDPNDVNFATAPDAEVDMNGSIPYLGYFVKFPVANNVCLSPAPNPYTSTTSAPISGTVTSATTFYNPQSFQIISSGLDGQYGVAGQYNPDVSNPLPLDTNMSVYHNTTDTTIRTRKRDNITNIHNGRLD